MQGNGTCVKLNDRLSFPLVTRLSMALFTQIAFLHEVLHEKSAIPMALSVGLFCPLFISIHFSNHVFYIRCPIIAAFHIMLCHSSIILTDAYSNRVQVLDMVPYIFTVYI
jgi:hypothetical protein